MKAKYTFILFLFSFSLFAQDYTDYSYIHTTKVPENTNDYYYGWKIAAGKDFGRLNGEWMNGFSLRAEFYPEKHFSIHWGFGYSVRGSDTRHIHVPLGVGMWGWGSYERESDTSSSTGRGSAWNAAGQVFALGNIFSVIGLVALTILPEGCSFHIYPSPWLTISPYINPFALDFMHITTTGERRLPYTPSIGSRVTFFEKGILSFSVYSEVKAFTKIGFGYFGGLNVTCKLDPFQK
ncbi:MAG: hypothetical protein ACOZCO_09065 [Bacteroidota bacterium]